MRDVFRRLVAAPLLGPKDNDRMIDVAVLGRVGIDLYPNQLRTPLREVRTYTRFVGGCAGNVATGIARLGLTPAIVSRVGPDTRDDCGCQSEARDTRRDVAGAAADEARIRADLAQRSSQ